jgi:hypothetical protein
MPLNGYLDFTLDYNPRFTGTTTAKKRRRSRRSRRNRVRPVPHREGHFPCHVAGRSIDPIATVPHAINLYRDQPHKSTSIVLISHTGYSRQE